MKYLLYRLHGLIVFAVFFGMAIIVLPMYSAPLEGILYCSILCLCILSVAAAFDFHTFKTKLKTLELFTQDTTVGPELLPNCSNPLEKAFENAVIALSRDKAHALELSARDMADMSDYFTTWTHQIKTPIAAMSLLLQRDDTPQSRSLKEQLFKTEQYVEMAMAYTRLGSQTNDFVFRKYALDDIVRQAIKKYTTLFIASGVRIDFRPTGLKILTDEKWLCFVIEQIISNSIKYATGGCISIYNDSEHTLVIEDNGIGIRPEDLPLIWEKGYTGYNGHSDKRASGIGLYLCRQIMTMLGHTISAESSCGRGTKINLGLQNTASTPEYY
ncbi:MAG: sensor histidine kinase [Clostridiaceae bacterium]|nr:sensor histidine kinase [Clostridiaceae bacterium]